MGRTLVSIRILEEVQLVVVFCIVPLPSFLNFGSDLLMLGREMLVLYFCRHTLCSRPLIWAMREDDRTVLCREDGSLILG